LVNYLAFVSYFPHQISGPIFHHSEMMPQFNNPAIFHPSSRRIAAGLWLASIGLFKKVIIADNLSVCAAAVFGYADHGHPLPFFSAWIGALAYTGQIYFDFSGYTDMALGISTLLGIKMPINFNSPYHSKSIIEFWRRWHMTLSRFLRDYLYIPLGGNRKGRVRRYVNLMVTMVLGGLWHGAGWTFLMWGTLHGIYLCINHAWRYLTEQSKLVLLCPEWLRNFSAWAATFLSVVVAWVFFRAKTFAGAFVVLKGMAGLTGIAWPPYFGPHVAQYLPTIVNGENWLGPITDIFIPALMVLVLFASFALPNSQAILRGLGTSLNGDKNYDNGWFNPSRIPLYVWALFFGLICGAGLAMMGGLSEFLYFNF
jgi:D-alanyl-lipoteichoic acid acyltransferase DltB (MBOAT superfamily)